MYLTDLTGNIVKMYTVVLSVNTGGGRKLSAKAVLVTVRL